MGGFQTVHMNAGAKDGTLREKRLVLEMTQQQVADKAKISLSSYQKFESGDRNIRTAPFEVCCRVVTALGMDPTAFYRGDYVFGEHTIFDKDGRKYVRTGRLVDEDIDDKEAVNVMRVHVIGSVLYIPMKILRALGSPEYMQIMVKEDERKIGMKILKQAEDNAFQIPADAYCGIWKGLAIADKDLMRLVYHFMNKPEGKYTGQPDLFEKGLLMNLKKMQGSDYTIPADSYYPLDLKRAAVENTGHE